MSPLSLSESFSAFHSEVKSTIAEGQLESAVTQIKASEGKFSKCVEYWLLMNDTLLALDLVQHAHESLLKAVSMGGSDSRIFLELGVLSSRLGRRLDAVEWFRQSMALDSAAYRPVAMFGLELMAVKKFDEARDAFEAALRLKPDAFAATVGLGLLEKRAGRLHIAAELFTRALSFEPKGSWAANELVSTYVAADLWNQAKWAAKALHDAGALSPERYALLHDYSSYFEINSVRLKKISDANELLMKPTVSGVRAVIDGVRSKKSGGLIRLGDGEGCFAYAHRAPSWEVLRAATHGYMSRAWFGASIPQEIDRKIWEMFYSAIRDSTVLGLPRSSRLRFEKQNDVRGAVGVAEALMLADEFGAHESRVLVDANINLEFSKTVIADALFESVDHLVTISPHPELGQRLRARYRIPRGGDLVIPGQADSITLPAEVRKGAHLARFTQSMEWISDNVGAETLVIVAGGLLGKCYVGKAQQQGAFGLDVGAVADLWMGYNTRGIHFTVEEANVLRLN